MCPQQFIACAHGLIGLGRRASVVAGSTGDPIVDDLRRAANIAPSDPWDLAFVHHVGWTSQRWRAGPRSSWPFPRSASHEKLAQVAQSQGLTVERPDDGDIVLHWSDTLKRHVRAGIVVGLSAETVDEGGRAKFHCVTVGVTAPQRTPAMDTPAAPDGWVRELETSICPQKGDLLVRWTLLDGRQATLDSRAGGSNRRPPAPWAFDEQLARCA